MWSDHNLSSGFIFHEFPFTSLIKQYPIHILYMFMYLHIYTYNVMYSLRRTNTVRNYGIQIDYLESWLHTRVFFHYKDGTAHFLSFNYLSSYMHIHVIHKPSLNHVRKRCCTPLVMWHNHRRADELKCFTSLLVKEWTKLYIYCNARTHITETLADMYLKFKNYTIILPFLLQTPGRRSLSQNCDYLSIPHSNHLSHFCSLVTRSPNWSSLLQYFAIG